LNEEVQNTLLKTLEEPPEFLTFVLTVPHPRLLLPTVVSRCLVEAAVANEEEIKNRSLIREILTAPTGRRLTIFEEKIGYNRDSAISFLEGIEMEFSTQPNPLLKEVWQAKKLLRDDSTNIKMVVDHFLLSW